MAPPAQTAASEIDFQSLAAHELRTPLTAMVLQLETLAGRLEGENAKLAEGALRSTQRITRLVEQLLEIARLDTNHAPERVPVDLAGVVMDVAEEREWMTPGVQVLISAQRAFVSGVRDDLHRLFFNLVDNAVSHTPSGTTIRVGVVTDHDTVTVAVQDNGPGIPAELRDRVFERFVRGKDGSGGSGLGLAIVSEIAQAHGGTVELESPQGRKGAKFVVTLPSLGPDRRVRHGRSPLRLPSRRRKSSAPPSNRR